MFFFVKCCFCKEFICFVVECKEVFVVVSRDFKKEWIFVWRVKIWIINVNFFNGLGGCGVFFDVEVKY